MALVSHRNNTLYIQSFTDTDEAGSTWVADKGGVEATAMEKQRIWVIDKGGTAAAAMDHLEEGKKLVKISGKSESVTAWGCTKCAMAQGHEFLIKRFLIEKKIHHHMILFVYN